MAQSFQQLQRQITELQAKADQLRQAELRDVVGKIKAAIATYGLTRQDLFGTSGAKATTTRSKGSRKAKYADQNGNTWGGMGKRPQWLRDALGAGAKLEDFLQAEAAGTAPKAKRASRGKKAGKPLYRDDAGNTWSGHGRRPGWFLAAIASGKTPDELKG